MADCYLALSMVEFCYAAITSFIAIYNNLYLFIIVYLFIFIYTKENKETKLFLWFWSMFEIKRKIENGVS